MHYNIFTTAETTIFFVDFKVTENGALELCNGYYDSMFSVHFCFTCVHYQNSIVNTVQSYFISLRHLKSLYLLLIHQGSNTVLFYFNNFCHLFIQYKKYYYNFGSVKNHRYYSLSTVQCSQIDALMCKNFSSITNNLYQAAQKHREHKPWE